MGDGSQSSRSELARRAERLANGRRGSRRYLQEALGGAARLAPALLPLLERAHGDAEHAGEAGLRNSDLLTRDRSITELDRITPAAAGLDVAHRLDQFGADVALRVALCDGLRGFLHGCVISAFNIRRTCAGI